MLTVCLQLGHVSVRNSKLLRTESYTARSLQSSSAAAGFSPAFLWRLLQVCGNKSCKFHLPEVSLPDDIRDRPHMRLMADHLSVKCYLRVRLVAICRHCLKSGSILPLLSSHKGPAASL
jgi:hypothetical protein